MLTPSHQYCSVTAREDGSNPDKPSKSELAEETNKIKVLRLLLPRSMDKVEKKINKTRRVGTLVTRQNGLRGQDQDQDQDQQRAGIAAYRRTNWPLVPALTASM